MKIKSLLFLLTLSLFLFTSCKSSNKGKEKEAIDSRPNILLIVADDLGYSDIEPFGGEISTPVLGNLAEQGIMLSNFHVLPACSPTRSVLMSGTDNHLAGIGSMGEAMTEKQKGQPGYEGYLNERVPHLPMLLKEAGYHTYLSGKWHLGYDDFNSPYARGFEETFTLLPGVGSHWADQRPLSPPQRMIYRRNGKIVKELPEDFYSSKDYTEYLISWLDRDKTDDNPFFAYLSFTAPHDPLHAPKEYIDKYRRQYDLGYNNLRKTRMEALKDKGIISEDAAMFPWIKILPKWEELPEEARKESAKDMEVYAAMVDYMDEQIGRVITWLEENNEMDNTFIIFFSDNGANGAMKTAYPGLTEDFLASFDNSLENRGLPGSFIELGPAWAIACMSPLRLFKGFTTEGGILSPCIIKLPSSMIQDRVNRSHAFTHVSDVMPTFLELAKIENPGATDSKQAEMIGTSMIPLLTGKVDALHMGKGIGYELHGLRAYIKGDWKILNLSKPIGTGEWELYNLVEDPAETNDLSATYPEIRNELISDWKNYAEEVGVVFDPIDMTFIK